MSLSAFERRVDENARRLRAFTNDFVQKRRVQHSQGQRSSAGNFDILSLFLLSPEIFTNEVITDELIDFFIAGTQTSSLLTQTMIGHFATT